MGECLCGGGQVNRREIPQMWDVERECGRFLISVSLVGAAWLTTLPYDWARAFGGWLTR